MPELTGDYALSTAHCFSSVCHTISWVLQRALWFLWLQPHTSLACPPCHNRQRNPSWASEWQTRPFVSWCSGWPSCSHSRHPSYPLTSPSKSARNCWWIGPIPGPTQFQHPSPGARHRSEVMTPQLLWPPLYQGLLQGFIFLPLISGNLRCGLAFPEQCDVEHSKALHKCLASN